MQRPLVHADALFPVPGCFISIRRDGAPARIGVVVATNREAQRLLVRWVDTAETSEVPLGVAQCGFQPHMEVLDSPEGRTGSSLGEGRIMGLRKIGGREQALVDFRERAEIHWLPYQVLRHMKGVEHRFLSGDAGGAQAAERFRLRNLARALELWNENTGSFGRFDIDPLPHQIHLVHHILASGNLNWVIADDVGLGKTIETGLLIAALKQRSAASRVLLVTPAGLTRQWQDDLKFKFGMDYFEIHGRDFTVNDPAHWKLHDHVIGSMDQFKSDSTLPMLLQAPPWDLIVFDEAHRLSRRQYGMKYESAERFRLAQALRSRTENLVLLTATPHQGMKDKFVALLELLRPEWKERFALLDIDASVLGRMVFRNRKADVTDLDGNFIFKGQTSRVVRVEVSTLAREFDGLLRHYLRRGYAAADSASGFQSRAIGFVMTVYRKLAASSVAALRTALIRRLARLRDRAASTLWNESELEDERFVGEWEERQSGDASEFFEGEVEALSALIERATELLGDDRKLVAFLDQVIAPIVRDNPTEKVLIFSEYRATQDYVAESLRARFGSERVGLLHGSLDADQRRAAIGLFENDGQFLISTEAGGEGINLQRRCHIVVNYDLPWNPMRLAQRVGRLYRYGQQKHVLAINLQAGQTADEEIVAKMYSRLEQVAQDMAPVSDEYGSNLKADILGELADVVDVEEILQNARDAGVQRTDERIDEALRRARASVEKQRELFTGAATFDPNELKSSFSLSIDHLKSFVFGMSGVLGIEIQNTKYVDTVWRLRLPDSVLQELPGMSRSLEVTFDRLWAQAHPELVMLDLEDRLVRYLLGRATHYDFQGLTATLRYPHGTAIATGILRWQNDRGRRLRQEYVVLRVDEPTVACANPAEFSDWLLKPAATEGRAAPRARNGELLRHCVEAYESILGAKCGSELHPEHVQFVGAAWVSPGSRDAIANRVGVESHEDRTS